MAGVDPVSWSQAQAARWSQLAEELRRRLGPGSPLGPSERRALEAHLDADLSAVAVHRGVLPGELARAVGADAFTVGGHVLGDARHLDVTTTSGAALLGHEVTHAVRAPAGPRVQRAAGGTAPASATGGDEATAQQVEAALKQSAAQTPAPGADAVDPDALADLVYRRIRDQLLIERERAAGISAMGPV